MKNQENEVTGKGTEVKSKDIIFRIKYPLFESEKDAIRYDGIVKKIEEDLKNSMKFILGYNVGVDHLPICDTFDKMSKEKQEALLNKALFTERQLNDKHQEFFLDQYILCAVTNLIFGMMKNRNIRCARSNTLYKTNEKTKTDRYYKAMGLKYEPFLMILDILELLGLITQYIGSPSDQKESTMVFSYKGIELFEQVLDVNVRFKKYSCIVNNDGKNYYKKPIDHNVNSELIIKNETVERLITKGKNKGKQIKVSVPVEFEMTDHIKRKIKRLEKINKVYEEADIKVNYDRDIHEQPLVLDTTFLKKFYDDWLECRIEIESLKCTIKVEDNILFNECNKDKSLFILINKLNTIKNINIKIDNNRQYTRSNHIQEGEGGYTGCESGGAAKICYINGLGCQKEGKYKVDIFKIKYAIKDKFVQRIYSRNSFRCNGRLYRAAQMNMNKELRKYISINCSPHYVSLDFSGMHLALCYHLNLMPAPSDPHKIEIGEDFIADNRNPDERRKIFKQLALVSINADNWKNAINATIHKLKNKDIVLTFADAIQYLKTMKNHHEVIKDCFNSDLGVALMQYDSEVIESVVYERQVLGKGLPVLSVHDEILCHPDDVNPVYCSMLKNYQKILERELKNDLKDKGLNSLPDDIKPVINID